MEIGNFTSAYGDIYNKAVDSSASKLEGRLKADYSKATDEEMMEACKQFESYFMEQIFKEMMKTVPKSEDSSSSTSTMLDYFQDEMIKSVAAQSTEQNSLGLAQMLFEQMKRNYGTDAGDLQAASEAAASIAEPVTEE